MKDGVPWWVLKDVCDALQIQNAADVAKRLDDDEKGVDPIYTLGGPQETTIISESGLYNVIIRSDKPEAKEFRRWITHEVLPLIRKQGYYSLTGTTTTNTAIAEIVVQTFKQLFPAMIEAMKESIKETIPHLLPTGTEDQEAGHYVETVYIRKKIGTEPLHRRCKIERLDDEIRSKIDEALLSGRKNRHQIYKSLKLKDYGIEQSGFYRYANKYF